MTQTEQTRNQVVSVQFDLEEQFASLALLEWGDKYNPASLDDLNNEFSDDSYFLYQFFLLLNKNKEEGINTNDMLTVLADEEGVLKAVYGPTIFQTEDGELVIKSGANQFPLEQHSDGSFEAGLLMGRIVCFRREDKEGNPYSVPYIKFKSKPLNGVSWIFVIKLFTSKDTKLSGEEIEMLADSGQAIASHLAVVNQSLGNWVKWSELGIGEHLLTGMEETSHPEYGKSFILKIGDRLIRANTRLKRTLSNLQTYTVLEKKLKAGEPLTLKITEIKDWENKEVATATIWPRAPKQPQEPMALPAVKTKQLVPSVENLKTAAVEEQNGKQPLTPEEIFF